MKRACVPTKLKLKWCTFTDFLHEPNADTSTKMIPVFRFSENRGVAWDIVDGYAIERPTDNMLVKWIRDLIDDPSLGNVEVCDFIGHPYVAMECKDVRFFWRAMEAFLRHDIGVFTQCRLRVNLPVDQFPVGDAPLTAKVAEGMICRDMHKSSEAMAYLNDETEWCHQCASRGTCAHKRDRNHCRMSCTSICYNHESSWLTEEGRALVQWVRRSLGTSHEEVSSDEEYTAPITAVAKETEEKVAVKPENEDWRDECMICMDARASTIAMPCGHVVVCSTCSEKLRGSNDVHTCVRCRRPITHVLE